MSCYIYLRCTQDWASCRPEDMVFNGQHVGGRICFRIWRRMLPIPYCEYRRRTTLIARSGWPLPVLTGSADEIADMVGDDDLVLPTDDDDYFHPKIADMVGERMRNLDVLTWNPVVAQTMNTYQFYRWRTEGEAQWVCSNGYCLRGRLLRAADSGRRGTLLHTHRHIKRTASLLTDLINHDSGIGPSCYNWHPGSYSFLYWVTQPDQMAWSIPTGDPPEVPARFSWINPQWNEWARLMRELCRPQPMPNLTFL